MPELASWTREAGTFIISTKFLLSCEQRPSAAKRQPVLYTTTQQVKNL